MQSMLGLPPWAIFAAVFLVAFLVTWGLTPIAARASQRLGFVALPGGRRQHHGAIPRLGGLAIYGGFMVAILLTLPHMPLAVSREAPDAYRLAGLLLGSTAIVIGGMLDERFEFSALPQMVITLVAALVAARYWVFLERVGNPFTSAAHAEIVFRPVITVILTLLWYAGMTTTVNWLDGLDGLATGVSAIAVLIFFVHMLKMGQVSVALLPLALLGATLGFLPRNWHPARVFIGSSGAYFLGFAVGALSLIGGAKAATALLVLSVPILDVAWLIFNRVRHRRSPSSGDRWHLHFRLVDLGLPQPRIVLLYYALCATLGSLAFFIPSRPYKLLALIVLGVIVLAILAIVSRLGERRDRA